MAGSERMNLAVFRCGSHSSLTTAPIAGGRNENINGSSFPRIEAVVLSAAQEVSLG
jgi:hypothetical protein